MLACFLSLAEWPTVFECLAGYCSKIRRNLGLVQWSSVFQFIPLHVTSQVTRSRSSNVTDRGIGILRPVHAQNTTHTHPPEPTPVVGRHLALAGSTVKGNVVELRSRFRTGSHSFEPDLPKLSSAQPASFCPP